MPEIGEIREVEVLLKEVAEEARGIWDLSGSAPL